MKLLVVYYSKTGFAKRYAQWLEKDLSCDCVPFAQRGTVDLSRYDGVVFGSSLRAGKIRKLAWFRKQLPQLSGKRLAVFFTGAMGPDPQGGPPGRLPEPDAPGAGTGEGLLPVGRPEL